MSYATRTQLEERYGADELAQRESLLTPGAVERALADADAEIDSYLASRYAVPVAPVPAILTRLCCAIGRYHLLGDAATEVARKAYEDARAFLREVQAGRAQLEGVGTLGSSGSGCVQQASSDRLFSREFR